jgi:hypothetical protein
LFSAKEKAALALTEALTHLGPARVTDEVYRHVRDHFSEVEISELALPLPPSTPGTAANSRAMSPAAGRAYGLDRAGLQ